MKNSKHIIVLSLLLLLSSMAFAQSSSIDRHFAKYKQDDRFTRISISGKMFSLFANFEVEDPAEQEAVQAMSQIKGFKMLVGDSIPESKSIYTSALAKVSSDMEELMTVENKDHELRFMTMEQNGIIAELLMVMYSERSVILMSLVGDIDLKQLSRISQKMDIQGFEHLENIGE